MKGKVQNDFYRFGITILRGGLGLGLRCAERPPPNETNGSGNFPDRRRLLFIGLNFSLEEYLKMGGTVEGGQKTRDRLLKKDPDFYRRIGAMGKKGGAKSPGSFKPGNRAKVLGAEGGAKSRRGKSKRIAVRQDRTAVREVALKAPKIASRKAKG